MDQPALATQKAKDLIRMAVAKAALSQASGDQKASQSARMFLSSAEVWLESQLHWILQIPGFHVYLVERRPTIGKVNGAV